MSLNIDVKLITDNLVELLTNTINISSLFEKIFDSEAAPTTLETYQYVYNDESQKIEPHTVLVENMSKIKQDLASSVGSKTSVLTQAEYDALPEKDPDVLYFII